MRWLGSWRRFVAVSALVFGASAALVGQPASGDDCVHGCPENEIDGRGCCRGPRTDEKAAADAKRAADAKAATEAKKATPGVPAAAVGCPSDMVHVPGATFSMGSPGGVGDHDEHPQHQVTLTGYCIDKTEVTVTAYTRCVVGRRCRATPEPAKEGDSSLCNGTRTDRQDHPVNCVDWDQATAYCAWAKKRLPSEAEWEYAARGGDGRSYPWGNEAPSAKRLNACGSECRALDKPMGGERKVMYEDNDGWEATAPVGSYLSGASPFGALDMAGNVWEWTADRYGTYRVGASTNPQGATSMYGTRHVVRGGGWNSDDADLVRAAFRFRNEPSISNYYVGFRCAKAAAP